MTPGMISAMMWGMPAISLAFTSFMPAAVQLSFFVSSSISFGQATLFRSPKFRSWANMTPLPNKNPSPSASTLRMREIASPIDGETKPAKRFSLDGSLGSVMDGFQSAKKGVMDSAKERREKSDDKTAKMRADAYERKRQSELAEEARRQNERRQLEREKRKMAGGRRKGGKN